MKPFNKYKLESDGRFIIENYNDSKTFSNFFPGIAGIWGTPMWVFYVNRGQGIASFGIESKEKAIMEFQPANKSYRSTPLLGFRTFIKIRSGSKEIYWEPFQKNLLGTDFRKSQQMDITSHDLTIEERNFTLGLIATVNYFTVPDEPYSGLVRKLTIKNVSKKNYSFEVIDGLPMILSYGLSEWVNKHMSRTVEAWIKVRNVEKKAPYYQLNVEVSDKPEVKHIKEGNFYFSFIEDGRKSKLLDMVVESAIVFGQASDYSAPENFINGTFKQPKNQQTDNRSPSALAYAKFNLKAGNEKKLVGVAGYATSLEQVNKLTKQALTPGFIEAKSNRNRRIIEHIKGYATTKSSSNEFDLYVGNTFMDNILRGGLPISLKTSDGSVAFNVYSRKHGDLERDYNHFVVAPTFFSQGNGNYRDVNQNRRNDVWFNPDVKEQHIINFMNLVQADGYNPLTVKGLSFIVHDLVALEGVLKRSLSHPHDIEKLRTFLNQSFQPGYLLKFVQDNNLKLKIDLEEFLSRILEVCNKEELADHGEGFWTDHWTYNLDLIESYLAIYPENAKSLIFEKSIFSFYHNNHFVLPRSKRYVLTNHGVRQYHSVKESHKIDHHGHLPQLRVDHGKGNIYKTTLIVKLLCLIANKTATLDPDGIGIEMEADKPNWYDALNGLPGRLGSSISETIELKRLASFVLDQLELSKNDSFLLYDELAHFIQSLYEILSNDLSGYDYWMKANEAKEKYREAVRSGIIGKETQISSEFIKKTLERIITKTQKAIEGALNSKGQLTTYFYYEVIKHEVLEKDAHHQYVFPLEFKRHNLPLFLEGYVHALRAETNQNKSQELYQQVKRSALFDKELKMYKVNVDLSGESEDIGRTRIFPRGWLENESIWLHMEYKFLLEMLRQGLYKEFFENIKSVLVPFMPAERYGRSVMENSSFIASSAHNDPDLHGQGFVARLSGSTAELLHMWLMMSVGQKPFILNAKGELLVQFKPILPGWLFTTKPSSLILYNSDEKLQSIELPSNIYAFKFLNSTLVVYHNPNRKDTFGTKQAMIQQISLIYKNSSHPVEIKSGLIPSPYSLDIREGRLRRIDIHLV